MVSTRTTFSCFRGKSLNHKSGERAWKGGDCTKEQSSSSSVLPCFFFRTWFVRNKSGGPGPVCHIWAPKTNHEPVFLRLGAFWDGAEDAFQTNGASQTPLLPGGNHLLCSVNAYLQLPACDHPHNLEVVHFHFLCLHPTTGLSCVLPSTLWKVAKAISIFWTSRPVRYFSHWKTPSADSLSYT